ncbi:MAG: 50S ribosomal protein L39e [Candidatus Altiarchaeales archaeon]|nr:50S ribosomal protein L39e [Candidatus Altiarchaeales archaeon]
MATNKDSEKKQVLVKENRTRKQAPVWVYLKTNRRVRDSPKSRRNWRRDSLF